MGDVFFFFRHSINDQFGHLNFTEMMIDPWLHHHVRLRMNAKSWGPLWHILPEEKETPVFEQFYRHPVMMLGINIYQTPLGRRWKKIEVKFTTSNHRAMKMISLNTVSHPSLSLSLSVKYEYGFTDINI